MNQYLLFDLDGTLTDPKIGITTCVQHALHSLGIEEPDLDKLEPFIGPPLKDSFMEFYNMDEEQAETAIAKYRERFSTVGMFENEVYPGIARMLRRCKKNGAKLAVASSKPEVFVKKILEHFHLAKYFDVIVGSELDGRRTDKEEVVREALHQLFQGDSIDYDNTVMIGDRKFDIIGAKDNKLVSVGVSYGYGSIEELKEEKPDYIARSVDELEDLLLRGRRKAREKADISWQHPSVLTKAWTIMVPIFVYVVVSDALRFIASFAAMQLSPYLPDSFIGYNASGQMVGLTGNAAAVVNSILFLLAFVIIYLSFGRTDMIQAKFAFNVRNANEYRGIRFTQIAYEWRSGNKYRNIFVSAIGVLLLGTGASIGFNFLFSLAGVTQMSSDFQAVSERQMSAGLLMGILLYGVFSPLAEEMIFRGVIFNRFKRYLPVTISGVISAVLFGIYHGNVVQALYGFIVGCLFAWIYHKRGSFVETVALHGIMNVTGFLLTYYNLFKAPFYGWIGCICAFVIAVMAFVWLILRR